MSAFDEEGPRLAPLAGTDAMRAQPASVARVDLEAPWRWLAAGWSDMLAIPFVSLAYGALFTAAAATLWLGLASLGWQSLMPALAGGFLLIGPALAVGLYEASRLIETGARVRLGDVLFAGFRAPGQLSLLGLTLLLIFLAWVEIAILLFMMFFADGPFPPLEAFMPRLLFTWQGVTLLVSGTVIGALFAGLVFSICAVSAPMLIDKPVGAAAAIQTSVRAVALNPKPMALWAALIAGFIGVGLATMTVGLIVIFPLIGHASWHAYRELVRS